MNSPSGLPVETPSLDKVKRSIELHFQEGFRGVRVDILCGNSVLASIFAKTQFQTGLAHIETLELIDGQALTISIAESDLKKDFEIDATKPFVTVAIVDGNLQTESTAIRPGYL